MLQLLAKQILQGPTGQLDLVQNKVEILSLPYYSVLSLVFPPFRSLLAQFAESNHLDICKSVE